MQSDAWEKNAKKSKPMKELHVDGKFTEDRTIWKEELQNHSEEVYEDVEETIEMGELLRLPSTWSLCSWEKT